MRELGLSALVCLLAPLGARQSLVSSRAFSNISSRPPSRK